MNAQPEPLQVTDRRRIVVGDNLPDLVEELPSAPEHMYVGQFYEINGVCYRVRKVTPHDVVLRRFKGTLLMPKEYATAIQLRGAKAG